MITATITIHWERFDEPAGTLATAVFEDDGDHALHTATPVAYRLVLRRVDDDELVYQPDDVWLVYVLEDSITGGGTRMAEYDVAEDALAMFLRVAADRVRTLNQDSPADSPLVDTEREQAEAIRWRVYGNNDHPDVQNADRAAIYAWLRTDRFPPEDPITSLATMWTDTANESGYNRQRILRTVTPEGARS
jgi:hypothetical protein